MSAHPVSPVLVGRSAELGRLEAALKTAPGALLVGGEAGVGKTRLLREFAAHATHARTLVGGCLELGSEGLPFAPFTAVLRALVREIGIAGVAELLPGSASGGLARLLPEFGEPETDAPSGEERARLFELVLTLLERLAERSPTVLVIEDAHWADRSTRDLLAFLIRNVGAAPLLIVITYRTDELHRGHPLRPLLAELSRVDRVRRMELTRLARPEVAELVRGLLGDEPPPGLVERAHERSEGNPLFVEALLARDGRLACELPESLRDLLLAAIQKLPEETQETLRVASAGATRIEHRLLSAVAGLDDTTLAQVLRPAVAGNVLVVDGDGYGFRHALIREAVHEDLLPGEHTRLHSRYAQALEDDPSLVPADRLWVELSHHWYSAHDALWALVSAWRAAREAHKALAYAESLKMLARVLELWDKVPDAAERIGATHAQVLEEATTAAERAGEDERGIKFATAALRELDALGADVRAAAVLQQRGTMAFRLTRPEFADDLRAAVRRLPEPTVERARALNTLSKLTRQLVLTEEPKAAAEEALALARELGDAETEAEALLSLFCVAIDYDGPLAELDQVEQIAQRSGNAQPLLRVAVLKSHYMEGAGRHEEAAEVAQEGVRRARQLGLARTQGAFVTINVAEPLVSLGRWDEAAGFLRQALEQDPAVNVRTSLLTLSGEIALARGDLAAAEAYLAPDRGGSWLKTQDTFAMVRLEAALRLAQGRLDDALNAVRQVLDNPGLDDDDRYAWPVLVIGAEVCAERPGDPMLARIEERANGLGVRGPLQAAHRTTFRAMAALARGAHDVAAWTAAADAWDAISQPYALARALTRAAEAALAHGDRDGSAAHLHRAAELAGELGAAPLLHRVEDLSRRARLTGGHPDRAPLGLTPRELEVLRLVAEGRSNRDIAETLFISAKTASVHVSNIIAKLGVTGRGEAAATAHRLGLFQNAPVR